MSICVVHLVRALNGVVPFKEFIRSYTQFRAGLKHDLLLIFKGFRENSILSDYRELLNGIDYKSMFIRDWGYDIRPYIMAVKKFDCRYFCFLNSFSTILDHDWLYKMYLHVSNERVGLVGATGSYQSVYTDSLRMNDVQKPRLFYNKIRGSLRSRIYQLRFEPFPNYHIRTNAFMVSRDVILKIRCGRILRKLDSLRFESGKDSLTRQIINMGLRVLVVGRDGKSYKKEEWFNSNTFYQGKQENLLVADNKTRLYLESDEEKRILLSNMVWGNNAIDLQ